MILIRGFNQEQYARNIQSGFIGFRDLLSTLLYPENNGYKYSDYYEEYIIKTAKEINPIDLDYEKTSPSITRQLDLIFNPFIPHFYLSYFHILNESSEKWIKESFDENAHFIYAIPKLQKFEFMDEMLFGHNLIGSRMNYLPESESARTSEKLIQKAGIVYLMQNELNACKSSGDVPLELMMTLNNMITSVCLEAFSRRCDDRFNAEENEFRIIYKTPTPYSYALGTFAASEERPFLTLVDGIPYEGTFAHNLYLTQHRDWKSHNLILETHSPLVAEPITTINRVFDSKRSFKLLPQFLPVRISPSFHEYGYIGDKQQCLQFIGNKLNSCN